MTAARNRSWDVTSSSRLVRDGPSHARLVCTLPRDVLTVPEATQMALRYAALSIVHTIIWTKPYIKPKHLHHSQVAKPSSPRKRVFYPVHLGMNQARWTSKVSQWLTKEGNIGKRGLGAFSVCVFGDGWGMVTIASA